MLFSIHLFGFREADIDGEEGGGVGEIILPGLLPAEAVDGGGGAVPEGLGEFGDVFVRGREEGWAVVVDAFAEERDFGVRFGGDLQGNLQENGWINQGGRGGLMQDAAGIAFVAGGKDLPTLGVEDGKHDLEFGRSVFGEDIERRHPNKAATRGLMHCPGDGHCNTEAGEASGAEREIKVLDLIGLPPLGLSQIAGCRHQFHGMPHRRRQFALRQQFRTARDGDVALAAGGFDGEDAGFGVHAVVSASLPSLRSFS